MDYSNASGKKSFRPSPHFIDEEAVIPEALSGLCKVSELVSGKIGFSPYAQTVFLYFLFTNSLFNT